MKRVHFLLLVIVLLSAASTKVVYAQADTPPTPTGPLGEIRGTVINRNSGNAVTESLEVMLHVLDLNYADLDMVHGQSQMDGTFAFADVPFDANLQFAVMATFDGVTYYSDVIPADMQSLELDLEVPVYETTKDLTNIQVDQMHVLFDVSPDGLETKELYILSNLGDRTVKDVYDLGNDQFAALQFPLPQDADYIFFQPEDKDRFVKQTGSFADTYPMLPGAQSAQLMVSYLIPYSGEKTYSYTSPVNVVRMNLLLPADANISLTGHGISGPETTTLKDNKTYLVYTYSDLQPGQTLTATLKGAAATPATSQSKTSNLLAAGAAFLGLGMLGAGIWWWRRPEPDQELQDPPSDEATFDELIGEIALLDETYQERGLTVEEYQAQRRELMQKAKRLSELEAIK
jgi:hypothetical protein